MILVTLFKKDEQFSAFVCAGHAGFAESGRDIVCAAVSALTYTCVNALESVAHVKPQTRVSDGFISARLPDGCTSHDAQVLLQGLYQGLCDIEAQYPSHIRLKISTESERRKHSC